MIRKGKNSMSLKNRENCKGTRRKRQVEKTKVKRPEKYKAEAS